MREKVPPTAFATVMWVLAALIALGLALALQPKPAQREPTPTQREEAELQEERWLSPQEYLAPFGEDAAVDVAGESDAGLSL